MKKCGNSKETGRSDLKTTQKCFFGCPEFTIRSSRGVQNLSIRFAVGVQNLSVSFSGGVLNLTISWWLIQDTPWKWRTHPKKLTIRFWTNYNNIADDDQVYFKQVQLFQTHKLTHQSSPGPLLGFNISIFYHLSTLVVVMQMVKAVNVTVVLLADCITAISFVCWVELGDQLGCAG